MMEFLRYMAGFFLQLFPCMLLLLLPFEKQQFRFQRYKTLIGFGVIALGVSAGLPALLQTLHSQAGGLWQKTPGEQRMELTLRANGYMLLCIVLGLALFWFAVRTELCKRLLVFLLAFAYGMIEYMTVNLFVYFGVGNEELYSAEVVFLYAVTTAVTYPLAVFFMKKWLLVFLKRHNSTRVIYRRLGMAGGLTLLYGTFIASIGPALDVLPQQEMFGMYLPYVLGYVFGTVFLCIGYWYMFWEIDRELLKNAYKHQLNIQKLRYDAIRGDMEAVKRAKHDMRHHFRVLGNFLTEGKAEEARQYLSHMDVTLNTQETETFCTEPVVNALLQYYIGEARSRGIACRVKVRLEETGVEDADMTVILGNCLENAIRACTKQEGPPFIRLKMGVVNTTLAILLENSSPRMPEHKAGRTANGFWSVDCYDENREGNGLGLSSIASTVAKYNGEAEFKYEKGVFYSRISMEI